MKLIIRIMIQVLSHLNTKFTNQYMSQFFKVIKLKKKNGNLVFRNLI